MALVHAESRREINSSQLLFGLTAALSDNWTSFTTHYNPNSWPPDQLGAQYLNVLQQHGYDLPSAIGRFLKQRLRLCFASVAVDWKKGAPVGTVHWGSCCPVEEDDPSSVGIQINIGAEIVWPLLAPDFTDKEKACCSMMLVSTVLHELAVSSRVLSCGAHHIIPEANASIACLYQWLVLVSLSIHAPYCSSRPSLAPVQPASGCNGRSSRSTS